MQAMQYRIICEELTLCGIVQGKSLYVVIIFDHQMRNWFITQLPHEFNVVII